MSDNVTYKLLRDHLLEGTLKQGEEIGIKIDQTLTQDALATMAYLQFEALGIDKVQTELSVSYVDHNTLQTGFENADDHLYLKSVAERYGIVYSPPGNGICHQVHLERFSAPGKTLLGSDSHTPTAGGLCMLAIGAGGVDVAVAMAGSPFYIFVPKVTKVNLEGQLSPWVGAKDIILEVLRRLSVKGGVGRILEYSGPGVETLSVPERATITNMGAELGATTSIFPSDERTKHFLKAQDRLDVWKPIFADPDSHYDEEITIDLSELSPLAACPHSPDAVKPVKELEGTAVHQVAIGSCTNSSLKDMLLVAEILKGKMVDPGVSLVISPGSRQVYQMLANEGALADLIAAGARIMEPTCGPCVGMGQAPPSGGVSVRTFNRNFKGRCGTADAQVYLTGPEVAAVTALEGKITDPRQYSSLPEIDLPDNYLIDDRLFVKPPTDGRSIEIRRGPNIKPFPPQEPLPEELKAQVALKVGDNITTDDIIPAGSKILPLRSNIPAISQYVFHYVDDSFAKRATKLGGSIVVGSENYGQGSSREHAALAPKYIGVKSVIAKSFARIHHNNLVNFGILPLTFINPEDYESLEQGDTMIIDDVHNQLDQEIVEIRVQNKNKIINTEHNLSERLKDIVKAGGLLNYVKNQS